MKLSELSVDGLRNLSKVSLTSIADVNLLYGSNGAGKTSVLEAIHMLGLARSFRGAQQQPVIQFNQPSCTVSGVVAVEQQRTRLGVERTRNRGIRIRVNGQDEKSALTLAQHLPIQMINASSYLLLEGGPKPRRGFLDWGVFHVEHGFYDAWQKVQRSIKQRNSLLRAHAKTNGSLTQLSSSLKPWNRELQVVAPYLDQLRQAYIERFRPVFIETLAAITDLPGVDLAYQRGWPDGLSYEQVLDDDFYRDLKRGLTHHGPHRADIAISFHGSPAAQVLSRGQQKLVVSAMRLAQSALLLESTGKRCVMLVDDLPAEIDEEHQRRLCHVLDGLGMQVFITCIDQQFVASLPWHKLGVPALFHVKQGQISTANAES